MNRNRLLLALVAVLMLMGNAYAANPKREMRSTWFTTVWGIDWPSTQGATSSAQTSQKKELTQYLVIPEEISFLFLTHYTTIKKSSTTF